MSLTLTDVEKIAKLSRLSLNEQEKAATLDKDGVEPMSHPHDVALRLRADQVTETDHAAEYQACAPDVRDRLYIVPQVIEE